MGKQAKLKRKRNLNKQQKIKRKIVNDDDIIWDYYLKELYDKIDDNVSSGDLGVFVFDREECQYLIEFTVINDEMNSLLTMQKPSFINKENAIKFKTFLIELKNQAIKLFLEKHNINVNILAKGNIYVIGDEYIRC